VEEPLEAGYVVETTGFARVDLFGERREYSNKKGPQCEGLFEFLMALTYGRIMLFQ